MTEKLNTGAAFPGMSLTLTDGTQHAVPVKHEAGSYQIVLFFRGKF